MSVRLPVVMLATALVVSSAASVIVSGRASAECAAWEHVRPARMSDFAGYAFRATVTESSDDVGPPPRGGAPFDWHVEMSVDQVYAGDVPETIISEGWEGGCASLRGDQLRVGDRLVIVSRRLPTGPEDLRWRGDSLVWHATPHGWRLYRRSFNVSSRFSRLPREARGYLTSTRLAALVARNPGDLPSTDVGPSPAPGGAVRGDPPTVGPMPDDPDAPVPDFIPVWHRDGENIAGYVASRDLAPEGSFPWWYQQPPTTAEGTVTTGSGIPDWWTGGDPCG
jgi:hypothetical protein